MSDAVNVPGVGSDWGENLGAVNLVWSRVAVKATLMEHFFYFTDCDLYSIQFVWEFKAPSAHMPRKIVANNASKCRNLLLAGWLKKASMFSKHHRADPRPSGSRVEKSSNIRVANWFTRDRNSLMRKIAQNVRNLLFFLSYLCFADDQGFSDAQDSWRVQELPPEDAQDCWTTATTSKPVALATTKQCKVYLLNKELC